MTQKSLKVFVNEISNKPSKKIYAAKKIRCLSY